MDEVLNQLGNPTDCTAAVIIKNNKILLGLRHYSTDKWKPISVWTTPGGRTDITETLGQALTREVYEETLIEDLSIEKYLGTVSGAKEGDRLFVFLCSTESDAKLAEPEKFSAWKWFSRDELPEDFINEGCLDLIRECLDSGESK